jgi:signal transduction histidine kinase
LSNVSFISGYATLDKLRSDPTERLHLAVTFADQAALAIENARLRVQAEQAAVMQERNRLARELHDSVSQALYGIALGTRTARKLLEREPVNQEVQASLSRPLDYVLSLADSGLAEMRALIFELRPDALEKQGLVAALERQITAFQARHKLETQAALCQEPKLPVQAKEALYRIAQEALNNVVKHAQATRVEIWLEEQAGAVTLEVQDDGVGFDPQGEFRGHLGLQSMRERAERLGGRLDINSAPGRGTLLRAAIPTPHPLPAHNSARTSV